jgi:hypothetical protein
MSLARPASDLIHIVHNLLAQFFLLFIFYTLLASVVACVALIPGMIHFLQGELRGPM